MYQLLETYRGVVYPWDIDHMGHMNVQFYTGRFDQGTWHFFLHLGLTPTFLKREERGMVAVDHRTHYKHEVLVGSLLHIRTELLEIRSSSLRLMHHMYNSESNEEVATTELVGVFLDTVKRTSVKIPDFVHEHAAKLKLVE